MTDRADPLMTALDDTLGGAEVGHAATPYDGATGYEPILGRACPGCGYREVVAWRRKQDRHNG